MGVSPILFFNSKNNIVKTLNEDKLIDMMKRIRFQNNPESRTPSPIDHTKRIGRYMGVHKELGEVMILVDDVFLDQIK